MLFALWLGYGLKTIFSKFVIIQNIFSSGRNVTTTEDSGKGCSTYISYTSDPRSSVTSENG
jgi:hypothetical protein